MFFIKGFLKVADNAATGGANNQGLNFSVTDDTSPYAGVSSLFTPKTDKIDSKKKNGLKAVAIDVATGKYAEAGYMLDTGNMPNSESTIASQLKWETNTATKPEDMGYQPKLRRESKRNKK